MAGKLLVFKCVQKTSEYHRNPVANLALDTGTSSFCTALFCDFLFLQKLKTTLPASFSMVSFAPLPHTVSNDPFHISNKGWLSERYGKGCQSMIFELKGISTLHRMRIVSHEVCISKKIEVSVGVGHSALA